MVIYHFLDNFCSKLFYYVTRFCKKNFNFCKFAIFQQILKVKQNSFPMMYHLSYLDIKHRIQGGGGTTPPSVNLGFQVPGTPTGIGLRYRVSHESCLQFRTDFNPVVSSEQLKNSFNQNDKTFLLFQHHSCDQIFLNFFYAYAQGRVEGRWLEKSEMVDSFFIN